MKAYKDKRGNVRLFRPDMNMRRLERSCKRIALPVCLMHQQPEPNTFYWLLVLSVLDEGFE
jgi:branched-subunit amino acid aminotransferase/4-amino-4-deoxychorismate lyase